MSSQSHALLGTTSKLGSSSGSFSVVSLAPEDSDVIYCLWYWAACAPSSVAPCKLGHTDSQLASGTGYRPPEVPLSAGCFCPFVVNFNACSLENYLAQLHAELLHPPQRWKLLALKLQSSCQGPSSQSH